jgi:hypothetical protein
MNSMARKRVCLDGQSLRIITLPRRTIIPEVIFKSSSRHVLFAPPVSQKQPEEAETSRNSLSWKILQGTPLL